LSLRGTLDIATLRSESLPQKCSGMARVSQGISQFHLNTHTFIRNLNEPYLSAFAFPAIAATVQNVTGHALLY